MNNEEHNATRQCRTGTIVECWSSLALFLSPSRRRSNCYHRFAIALPGRPPLTVLKLEGTVSWPASQPASRQRLAGRGVPLADSKKECPEHNELQGRAGKLSGSCPSRPPLVDSTRLLLAEPPQPHHLTPRPAGKAAKMSKIMLISWLNRSEVAPCRGSSLRPPHPDRWAPSSRKPLERLEVEPTTRRMWNGIPSRGRIWPFSPPPRRPLAV